MQSPPSSYSCVAVVRPASLVHSLYDFYVEQESWISSQLQATTTATPSPIAAPTLLPTPSPPPSQRLTRKRQLVPNHRRTRSHPQVNPRTRLTHVARQSPLLHRRRRQARPTLATKRTIPRSTISPSSFPATPTLPSTPIPSPPPTASSAGAQLLSMYADMVRDRMQSCMRLEEMVRDAQSKDLFAIPLF